MPRLPAELDELEFLILGAAPDPSGGAAYFVQLTDRPAQSDSEQQYPKRPAPFSLPAGLATHLDDPAVYGQALGDALFGVAEIRDAVQNAIGRAGANGFRFRLFSDEQSIQDVRWETLLFKGQPLFAGGVCFSRYLSPNAVTPKPLPRPSLKSLIFIANPQGLDSTAAVDDPKYSPMTRPEQRPKLAAIDVAGERARAEKNLTGQSADGAIALGTEFQGSPGGATLPQLVRKLSDGYDILYVICHGAWNKGDPKLYVEDDKGAVLAASATELAQNIALMPAKPRLVVLASCQSAGSGEPTVASQNLSSLGPMLARAGVPAVIAMQGFITIATVDDFMPKLFAELRQHGQVDRAVAAARAYAKATSHGDYWMPVLFSSSRSGTLFQPYSAGFEKDDTPWQTITSRTQSKRCVPVLGPDCLEPIWGSTMEIAATLAHKYGFPLEEHQSENLPAVAQFIRQDQDPAEYANALDAYITQRCPDAPAGDTVWDRIAAVAKKRRADGKVADAHQLLAKLPYPVYLTACVDRLLEDALVEAGKTPVSDFARWNEALRNIDKYPKVDATPSVDAPLVYHLFGDCKFPRSMVVTDDDFTDYMLGINTPQAARLTPTVVDSSLAGNALLFIGFHFKHRGFQIVLRNTLNRINEKDLDKMMWVGAQMPPDPDRYLRVAEARKYIDKTVGADLKIFWGGVQEFIDHFAENAKRDLPDYFRALASAGIAS